MSLWGLAYWMALTSMIILVLKWAKMLVGFIKTAKENFHFFCLPTNATFPTDLIKEQGLSCQKHVKNYSHILQTRVRSLTSAEKYIQLVFLGLEVNIFSRLLIS